VRKGAVSVELKQLRPIQIKPLVADRHLAVLTIWRSYTGVGPTSLAGEDFNTTMTHLSALSRSFPLRRSLSHLLRQRRARHYRHKFWHRVGPPSLHHFPIERANSSALFRATISTPLPSPSSLGMGALPFLPPMVSLERRQALSLSWPTQAQAFSFFLPRPITFVGRRNSRR